MNPDLVSGVVQGEPVAVSRALNCVVNEEDGFEELLSAFFRYSGSSHKIGFCGPPGCGKSSILARLVTVRRDGSKLGILAVDPTSSFTGGAFLGDRIRIQSHATDPNLFMRSLASRGSVGGLVSSIFGAVHVMEAYGCGKIMIETVGTGQDEIEISKVADTVVYVTTPSLGDEIQAMKAGAMEIGDIFVVNKADLGDSEKAVYDIRRALEFSSGKGQPGWPPPQPLRGAQGRLKPQRGVTSSGDQRSPKGGPPSGWKPRVIAASAVSGQGMPDLAGLISEHGDYLKTSAEGKARRKAQVLEEVSLYVSRRLYRDVLKGISDRDLESLVEKESDPVAMGKKLLKGKGR